MKTYNKGEWSELYAICKILHDQILRVCDSNLNPTNQKIRILKLLMQNISGNSEYDVSNMQPGDISIIHNGKLIKSIHLTKKLILNILQEIATSTGSSFSISSGELAMNELLLNDFKATSYRKSDIETISIMPYKESARQIGFSIKSQIGHPATLLNASKSTNFIYEVSGFSGDIDEANNITTKSKIKNQRSYPLYYRT